ncbi:MAG: tyrosine-protein phosphatase [Corallococcus sp.]|nr:tyrosine-protein phosphatase [Bacillota bacterium]MCM1533126.1 tyrosine-protein phosphatase [Corallococcus sp.]
MYYKQKDFGVKYAAINIDNFRDLGGIVLSDGRVLCDGMIFRSGELFGLTDSDKSELDKLGINCIFDLRSQDEVDSKPDYVPCNATYYNIPAVRSRRKMAVKPDSVVKMIPVWLPSAFSRGAFRWLFKRLYRKFPFNNPAYRKIFEAMDEGKTLLFHCTAGKDRTGVASMLILLALGADMETVKNDYMLSNFYRAESSEKFMQQFSEYKHYDKYRKILKMTGDVEMGYFDTCYNKIIRKYKTVKNFLLQEYDVDEVRIDRWLQTYAM